MRIGGERSETQSVPRSVCFFFVITLWLCVCGLTLLGGVCDPRIVWPALYISCGGASRGGRGLGNTISVSEGKGGG